MRPIRDCGGLAERNCCGRWQFGLLPKVVPLRPQTDNFLQTVDCGLHATP